MNFIKNILKSAIKGVITFFISLFMIIFLISIVSALFSSDTEKEVTIEPNSLLYINNLSIIGDRDTKPSELDFNLNELPLPIPILDNSNTQQKISLKSFESILESAKDDDNIKGIYLNLENVTLSFNKSKKVRDLLKNFKETKPIYSFSDLQTKNAYYISSISNFIAISPPGFISVSGFGINSFFYKNLFEELGINIQLFRVGEYKGAAETYVRNDFSEENKEQYLNLLNYRMENYLEDISSSREISEDKLLSEIEKFNTELAVDALANNLVDSLLYEDQMEDYLKIKVDSSYNEVNLFDYRKSLKKTNRYNKNKVAVLYAIGDILPGSGDDGIYSETIIKDIKKIRKNKNIKSVILYVNSGGGSAFASDLITRELELLAAKKPLVTYMSDVCASGGYFIAMPSDTIIASEGSIVGSIGVFGILPELSTLIKEKLKISVDEIKTNNNVGEIDFSRPLTNDERNLVQRGINQVYDDFLDVVSKGRNITKDQVDKLARGKVYYGNQGKDLNLIDVIGDFNDAINIASKLADLEKFQLVEYPKQKTEIEKLLVSLQKTSLKINPLFNENDNWLIHSFTKSKRFDPFQMRIEYKID